MLPDEECPGVLALNQACPTCGVEPGRGCVTSSGRDLPVQVYRQLDGVTINHYPGIHAPRMSAEEG